MLQSLTQIGSEKIKSAFQSVKDFKNGYVVAKQNDLWGIIDKTGKWVIEPIYGGIKDVQLSD